MRAEAARRNLKTRGDPALRSRLALASVLVDDEGTSLQAKAPHHADRYAVRDYRDKCAPCWLAPRRAHELAHRRTPSAVHGITAFRHSVGGFARRAPRATAV